MELIGEYETKDSIDRTVNWGASGTHEVKLQTAEELEEAGF
jgi:hypothetical protein